MSDRLDKFMNDFADVAWSWCLDNERRLRELEWPLTDEFRAAVRRLKSAANRAERRPK
jgi:hypothetical protein